MWYLEGQQKVAHVEAGVTKKNNIGLVAIAAK
jgi:hypothetical protein